MKFKKRYIIIPIVILLIILLGIVIFIKLDRDYQRKVIEQDEAEYGNEYLKLENSLSYYTGSPDRIIYKPKMKDYFYVFEKADEDYTHLLEVAEDRMCYSLMTPMTDDFHVDSMDRIMSSGKNYIILDYDKEKYANIGVDDGTTPRPVVYKLLDNNRCARLIRYLTQFRKRYRLEELEEMLGKTGFSRDDVNITDSEEMEDGYTKIYTIDDFRRISNNATGKYRLANDLNFNGESVQFTNVAFSGELDGNGHTIKNIRIDDESMISDTFSMFYQNQGTIKNVTFENIDIHITKELGYYPSGVICQRNAGTIENCSVTGNIVIEGNTMASVAGISGMITDGSIKNCISKVNIQNENGSVAGICDTWTGGTIESCINEGNLEGSTVIGICTEYRGTLQNCENKGNLIATSGATGIIIYNQGTIINCRNSGDITSENGLVSGIVTYNNGTIESCENTGNLTGANNVAGIANANGDANDITGGIKNSTSSGTITINTAKQYEQEILYIGGIAGNHILGKIEGCTFNGNIVVNTNKTTYKGNLAGAKSTKATIDTNNGHGYNYDFETYYNEHWMETLRD